MDTSSSASSVMTTGRSRVDPMTTERDIAEAAARVGTVRTAGKIEFVKDTGPLRRDIRTQGFNWDPEIHRNLAKTLWAVDRAHSYGMAALRLFSKMNSSEFSPDGLLGGIGYIQKVKDLRSGLSQAVEVLSSFADTMHDEVQADHWQTAMEKDPTTEHIISEAEQANPEQYVRQTFQEEVPSAEEGLDAYRNPDGDDFNPFVEDAEEEEQDEDEWWSSSDDAGQAQQASALGGLEVPLPGPKSGVPTDDGEQEVGASSDVEAVMNTTGEFQRGNYAAAIERLIVREPSQRVAAFRRSGEPVRIADSSVDPNSLPGPRILHVGPAESPEELGGYTDDSSPADDPGFDGFQGNDPIYEGEDANMDGVTGYSDPTDGDVTIFSAAAARVADGSYSWLPGSRNERLMPYYDRGVSEADVEWMRANDTPEPPASMAPKPARPSSDPLWDAVREASAVLLAD